MLKLHLVRGDNQEGVYLNLPTTPGEIGEAYAMLDTISRYAGEIRIADVKSTVHDLKQYIQCADLTCREDLEKLNQLASIINGLDKRNCWILSGALSSDCIEGLDDVLKVVNNLDAYELIEDVGSDRELGGYMVENGFMEFPEKVWPYLDYAGIGAEQYDKLGGAYTLGGYVLRKENVPKHELDEIREKIFQLHLSSHYGAKHSFLSLPATVELLETTKSCLQIDEFAEADIEELDTLIPYLKEHIPMDCISVGEANDLAECIELMKQTDGELLKYLSVLTVKNPGTFIEALNIAMDLDEYERVSSDPYEYGQEYLRRIGANSEILDALNGYTDFAELGQDRMKEDGVRYTDFGSVRSLNEPFPQQMGGMVMQ